jgi:replicative DNA helicase Mcm
MPDLIDIDEQKLAIILSLVRGGNAPREEIHTLFAGEPGVAKSKILKDLNKMIPNVKYANGASSSSVGLTASVVKDEFTGGWSLQAGAVVMANEGVACIDEVDKMKDEEKNDLNECAEQGTVTINKAGISGSLQAKTTLIMASNPKNHIFDTNTDFITQLNLPHALITRFDLLFILRNTFEETYSKMCKANRIDYNNLQTPISEELLVKYLMVARDKKPMFSNEETLNKVDEIMLLIKNYVISGESKIPYSMRQLHAIKRISTGFAKLRLADEVLPCDVENAWKIYHYCLLTLIGNEKSKPFPKVEEKVYSYTELVYQYIKDKGFIQLGDNPDFDETIQKMSMKGDIFEFSPGKWKVLE